MIEVEPGELAVDEPIGTVRRDRVIVHLPLGPFATVSAWGHTCEWVARLLADRELLVAGRPLRVAVENRTAWRIAFGGDELSQVLTSKLPPGVGRAEAVEPTVPGVDLRVVVVGVEDGKAITIDLEWAGRRLCGRRILVSPPWPAWFAIGPAWKGWEWLYLPLAALGVVTALRRGWSATRPAGRLGRRTGVVFGLVLLMLLPAIWPFLRDGAAPRSSPARGGRVVFEVPAGPGVPSELNDFTGLLCGEVCRALAGQVVHAEAGEELGPWGGWLPAQSAPQEREPSGPQRVVDLRYEVWSTSWRDGYCRSELGQGRVRDATEAGLRAMLDSASGWADGEPVLPQALLGSLEPDVTLSVVIHDGDHGGLVPPRGPARTEGPVLAVWTPTGTRDGRDLAALDARSRFARLERGSRVALSPLGGVGESWVPALEAMADGSRLGDLDDSGCQPLDLDALRDRLWKFRRPADLARLREFAAAAGAQAVSIYQTARPATSRTALRRPWGSFDRVWIALVPWVLALLLWSRLPASSARTWPWVLLGALGAVAVLLSAPAVLYACALGGSGYWVLGLEIAEGLRLAYLAVAGGVILAVVLAWVAWGLEHWSGAPYSQRVRGDRGLWARRSRADGIRHMVAHDVVVRLLGLVLLGAALACWMSEPVAAGGMGAWRFLASERSGLLAGLCLWAFGVVALGPDPIRRGSRTPRSPAR
jgi:hypothetical protein